MDFGIHLPLIDFGGQAPTLDGLRGAARVARDAGYRTLCINDHLVFSSPWLDAPTALGAVLAETGDMRLMTTVALAVVRGPAAAAKWLGAVDVLSGGRVVAGVGPGSSPRDYALAGVPWEERWPLLDDAIAAMRALWRGEQHAGRYYATDGVRFEAAQAGGPPVWVGSWGSEAGLRRATRLADGWLASAYNTTPEAFGAAWRFVREELARRGRDVDAFGNGLATGWMYVTDDPAEADRVLLEVLVPMLNRPPEDLRRQVFVGSAESCARLVLEYAVAGLQRVFVWPLADWEAQARRFHEQVVPLVQRGLEA